MVVETLFSLMKYYNRGVFNACICSSFEALLPFFGGVRAFNSSSFTIQSLPKYFFGSGGVQAPLSVFIINFLSSSLE